MGMKVRTARRSISVEINLQSVSKDTKKEENEGGGGVSPQALEQQSHVRLLANSMFFECHRQTSLLDGTGLP